MQKKYSIHFDSDSLAPSLDFWSYKFKRRQREDEKECLGLEMRLIYFSNLLEVIALPCTCLFLQSPKSLTFGQFSVSLLM